MSTNSELAAAPTMPMAEGELVSLLKPTDANAMNLARPRELFRRMPLQLVWDLEKLAHLPLAVNMVFVPPATNSEGECEFNCMHPYLFYGCRDTCQRMRNMNPDVQIVTSLNTSIDVSVPILLDHTGELLPYAIRWKQRNTPQDPSQLNLSDICMETHTVVVASESFKYQNEHVVIILAIPKAAMSQWFRVLAANMSMRDYGRLIPFSNIVRCRSQQQLDAVVDKLRSHKDDATMRVSVGVYECMEERPFKDLWPVAHIPFAPEPQPDKM